MGVAARKAREKEEMRQRILDAALELLTSEGYERTSIRKIADKIEYSPATIYLYFKDKEELLRTIQEDGFRELCRRQEALQVVSDPLERILAHGRAYIKFAVEQPQYYHLMFVSNIPVPLGSMPSASSGSPSWGMRSFLNLQNDVKACIDAGVFKPVDVLAASMLLWANVHGIASFIITKRWKMIPEEQLESFVSYLLQLGIEGLRK